MSSRNLAEKFLENAPCHPMIQNTTMLKASFVVAARRQSFHSIISEVLVKMDSYTGPMCRVDRAFGLGRPRAGRVRAEPTGRVDRALRWGRPCLWVVGISAWRPEV
ncbi:hypothetical protein H5410_002742 [Solanum commersonii]|uniref:Uncharacterized protein n=1 Tax=Solanum commersonii TaxID=4109 RepID=A0A9J6B2U6_SOLCO|nr:hypothetical protein H5410_002742 [Solanum commersonii]